jgi:hypothetical protein
LDTGISQLRPEVIAMRHAVVPVAKALTAAAALFTVLWACGSPPTQPSRPELAGTWEGTIQPPPEPPLPARMVITGNAGMPRATMTVGEKVYGSASSPASTQNGTSFVLYLNEGGTLVTLTGDVSPDGRFMSGRVVGLSPTSRFFSFDRR